MVVTDMMMPGVSGPATIRALRKLNPALKIIAASGMASEAEGAVTGDLAANGYILKPFKAAELLKTVYGVLHK